MRTSIATTASFIASPPVPVRVRAAIGSDRKCATESVRLNGAITASRSVGGAGSQLARAQQVATRPSPRRGAGTRVDHQVRYETPGCMTALAYPRRWPRTTRPTPSISRGMRTPKPIWPAMSSRTARSRTPTPARSTRGTTPRNRWRTWSKARGTTSSSRRTTRRALQRRLAGDLRDRVGRRRRSPPTGAGRADTG